MKNYSAGKQYASETHVLNDVVTINIINCHMTTELRIYSSSTNNGIVISNNLGRRISSMTFNIGYKIDTLNVYGSTDGENWTLAGTAKTTTSRYEDITVNFPDDSNYTYFKLDVAGNNQLRIKEFSITLGASSGGAPV